MSRINLAFVILICILLLPFIANAKECNQNNIKVESIILEDTRGNIEEVSAPNSDDGKIHLDLKMNVVGDFAEYKIILKNTSDEEDDLLSELESLSDTKAEEESKPVEKMESPDPDSANIYDIW